MTELRPVDRHNIEAVLELRVTEAQAHFVAPNVLSLAQTVAYPECIPLAVYAYDEPVGFLMYCIDNDDGDYWLYRLMVDAGCQGRGHGRAAMEQLLARIKADPSHHRLYLGVEPENQGAIALYQSLGFRFDGRAFGKERCMLLEY